MRLKGGYVIECTGCTKDARWKHHRSAGHRGARHQERHPGADSVKVKAAITWVGVADGVNAEVRMYDRLFSDAHPDAGGKNFGEPEPKQPEGGDRHRGTVIGQCEAR